MGKYLFGLIIGMLIGIWLGFRDRNNLELKAARPQWHKVADGDLPKEQKEYWCKVFFYESEETFNAFLWFDLRTKDFKFLEDIKEGIPNNFKVKSWCEIPA